MRRFVIVRISDGSRIETWETRQLAERALKTLNDHEESNGRGRPYEIREEG